MDRRTYVPCERCGVLNRVAPPPPGKAPVCGRCRSALPYNDGVVEVSAKGLSLLVEKSPVPVLVDFWAEWCAPCRVFAPTYLQVAKEESGRAVFAKLDTERWAEAAQRHRIQAIPTLLVLSGGREVARQSGALSASQLKDYLDRAIGPGA